MSARPPFDLTAIGAGLPAAGIVPALEAALREGDRAVVEAPPGSGKTTVVPPLVANLLTTRAARAGRVLVTQPRRIAARAAARRLATLSGARLGEEVGYSVRGESRRSARTRVEFVTAGLLLRQLLADPALEGVDAVVLDEVHERDLDADLAFALVREVAELRDDLVVIAMSATLDAPRWARLLGDAERPAPICAVEARPHPLAERWAPTRAPRLDERGPTREFLAEFARLVADSHVEHGDGSTLAFVPGHREVDLVVESLRGRGLAAVPSPAGSAARSRMRRSPCRRRTSVASWSPLRSPSRRSQCRECGSSSTRASRASRASTSSATSRGSSPSRCRAPRASSAPAAPRARRPAPWCARSARASGRRSRPRVRPEIRTADLTAAALALAACGAPGGAGLLLPDAPPPAALERAHATLAALGAIEREPLGAGAGVPGVDQPGARVPDVDQPGASGPGAIERIRITPLGRRLAAVPAHPRTARALLDGAALVGERTAAEVVAALELGARAPGGDLAALLRRLRRGEGPDAARWRQDARRLRSLLGAGASTGTDTDTDTDTTAATGTTTATDALGATGTTRAAAAAPVGSGTAAAVPADSVRAAESAPADSAPAESAPADSAPAESPPLDSAIAIVTALAQPERLARARGRNGSYLLAGGTGAALPRDSALRGQPWLAIAEVARGHAADGSGAVIRAAVPIDEQLALEVGAELVAERTETSWSGRAVTARRILALGAIELRSTPVAPTEEEARACIAERLAAEGVSALHWSPAAEALRRRLALLHRELGAPWPEVGDDALAARLGEWLAPELDRLAVGQPVERIDLHAALQRLLPWPEATRLAELAPERIEVPSGSSVTVDYPPLDEPEAAPVLAVKLQECFGWETTPRLVDGHVPVLMHLLSPARRPLAVTDDLASFWSNAYAQVRSEMRGRYPKHPWPEDPRTAPPRRGTTRSGR